MERMISTRNFAILVAWSALIAIPGITFAQWWGTNAPVCPQGHCAPARGTWGFYPTRWRQWPGAIYPDMSQPMPQPGSNQIQPSEIELPNPNKEAEVQTPNPARDSMSAPGGSSSPSERLRGSNTEPTPARSPLTAPPSDLLPSPKSAPGAMPDEPNFGPPSSRETPMPSGRSSGTQRVRPHVTPQEAIATAVDTKEQRNQRVASGEPKEATPLKPPITRINGESTGPALSPDAEPDLIIPSLSSRPLHTSSVDPRNDRSASNPLREDIRNEPVTPVMLIDSDSATISNDRPAAPTVSSGSPGTVRSNPLRRN